MPITTLKVPLTVDPFGKLVTLEGSEAVRQIIFNTLSEGDSENPFQELDLFSKHILKTSFEEVSATLKLKIKQIFEELTEQNIAALDESSGVTVFLAGEEKNELSLQLTYVNLQTDEPENLNIKFKR